MDLAENYLYIVKIVNLYIRYTTASLQWIQLTQSQCRRKWLFTSKIGKIIGPKDSQSISEVFFHTKWPNRILMTTLYISPW